MKSTLKTWTKGNTSYLRFSLECANEEYRDAVRDAVQKALAGPEPEKEQKPSAMGFQAFAGDE